MSSFTRIDTPFLSLTLPSLSTSACKVCYDTAHSTLDNQILHWEVLPNISAIRKRRQKIELALIGNSDLLSQAVVLTTIFGFKTTATHPHRPNGTPTFLSPQEAYRLQQKAESQKKTRATTLGKHIPDPIYRLSDTSEPKRIDKDHSTTRQPPPPLPPAAAGARK